MLFYNTFFQTSMNVTRHLARMKQLATTLNHLEPTAVTVCLVLTAQTVKLVRVRDGSIFVEKLV